MHTETWQSIIAKRSSETAINHPLLSLKDEPIISIRNQRMKNVGLPSIVEFLVSNANTPVDITGQTLRTRLNELARQENETFEVINTGSILIVQTRKSVPLLAVSIDAHHEESQQESVFFVRPFPDIPTAYELAYMWGWCSNANEVSELAMNFLFADDEELLGDTNPDLYYDTGNIVYRMFGKIFATNRP